jgi:acyl carrier protein|tara:strand:- start:552 stop:833 length:282 start_codon:yes stop_codon:yes gene_type:complete
MAKLIKINLLVTLLKMIKTKKKIEKIILKVFKIKKQKKELNVDSIDNWDSIGHLHVISALEKEFKINISSKQISKMLSEKAIYEVVSKIKKTN